MAEMKRFSLLLLAAVLAACAHSGEVDTTLVSIKLSPATATLNVGASQSFSVVGTYSDNSTAPVTSGVTWSSGTLTVAVVSPAGLVTGVGAGSDTITATVGTLNATAAVTVGTVAPATVVVFDDNYGTGLTFNPYSGVTVMPVIDTSTFHSGTASLRIDVPATNYVGGAFKNTTAIDLSHFNALSFWAKASVDSKTFDAIDIGNDSVTTTYQAEIDGLPLTTTWTQYYIPIPDPSKLTAEDGLFAFAEGSAQGPFSIWLDDIEYVTLDASAFGAASIALAATTKQLGASDVYAITTLNPASQAVYIDETLTVNGAAVTLAVAPAYFSFASSDATVATVDASGKVTAVAPGTANITVKLGAAMATVAITVIGGISPTAAAPTPTDAAANSIAILSGSEYTDITVDDFLAQWSMHATESPVQIAGVPTEKYAFSAVGYLGIEFITHEIDATAMDSFHLDLWTHDATDFKIKLVDFGANGTFDANGHIDDSESELDFTSATTPALIHDGWVSFDIPLSAFSGLAARAHLAQLVLSASAGTLYIENIYFHTGNHGGSGGGAGGGTGGGAGGGTGGGAGNPTGQAQIFADAYGTGMVFAPFSGQASNVSIDSTMTDCHSGTACLLVPVPATGNIGGAITTASAVDLSSYDSLSFWVRADAAHTIGVFGFGDNAAGSAPFAAAVGSVPVTSAWTQIILPIPDPTKLTGQIGMFYFSTATDSGAAYNLYLDDIAYQHLGSNVITAATPAIPATTLTLTVGATHNIDGCSETWQVNNAAVTETVAPGYFVFTASAPSYASVDASGTIHALAVTPSETGTGVADTITATLAGASATGGIGIIVDGSSSPTTAAPTPTLAAANVISLFGGTYTNVPIATWETSWTPTVVIKTDSSIGGVPTKEYSGLSGEYLGIEIETSVATELDVSSMTTLHMDAWTTQTQAEFQLYDFGPDGTYGNADDSHGNAQLTFTPGTWTSIEIPLATFMANGLTHDGNLGQMLLISNTPGDNLATIYLENIYFHK